MIAEQEQPRLASPDDEAQVIGYLINGGEIWDDMDANLFASRENQLIFLTCKRIWEGGMVPTFNDVYVKMKKGDPSYKIDYILKVSEIYLGEEIAKKRMTNLIELKNKREVLNLHTRVLSLINNGSTSQRAAEFLIEQAKEIAKVSHGGRSLTQEIRDLLSVTKGHISVTEVEQSVTNRHTKKGSVRKLLARLAKNEGIIEPTSRAGIYRVVARELDKIDFMNVKDTELDFRWPMQIEQFFRLMPKNIVVIAGEPDSGKTAFLLNVAALNMHKYKIKYFSSEMGALELRSRLEQWQYIEDENPMKLEDWNNENFMVYERISDFSDVIDPEGINIIDFLEIHNEFYRVSEYIREMFDKLTTGVAIIAIQKNQGAQWGLGGQRTIEKARLAVNLNNKGYVHSLQLSKVKNWRVPEDNPNYMTIEYNLVRGCYFNPQSSWVKEYPRQGESNEQSNPNGQAIKRTRVENNPKRYGSAERFNRNFGKA